MRFLKIIAVLLLLGGGVALAVYGARHTERAIRSLTIEVLRSLPRAYLVMMTQREIAVATTDHGGIIFGPRIGHASANRQTHVGLDMEAVTPGDIEVLGSKVSIRIPSPTVLGSAIDYGTVNIFTKRSGFQLLRDLAAGRSIERELLDLLSATPPELTGEDLRAQRQSFVDRLNHKAGEMFKAKGLSVTFK